MVEGAVRVDGTSGIEERLQHVSTPRGKLYTWTAKPASARSCVVICSSLLGDFTANYHRERLLGHALARLGYGAIRFHYSGEGNSQGDRRHMTFGSLCEDTMAVLAHGESLGFSQFALVGTRLGSLVAASTAANSRSMPIALWEPVTDPIRFIGEAQRAKRISEMAQDSVRANTDWRAELEGNGVLDLLGYAVYPALVSSLENVNLLTALGTRPRDILLARFSAKPTGLVAISDSLIDRGWRVETRHFGLNESWWFESELVPESGELVTETTAWLASVFPEAA